MNFNDSKVQLYSESKTRLKLMIPENDCNQRFSTGLPQQRTQMNSSNLDLLIRFLLSNTLYIQTVETIAKSQQ